MNTGRAKSLGTRPASASHAYHFRSIENDMAIPVSCSSAVPIVLTVASRSSRQQLTWLAVFAGAV
jgi:hypothetical protein